MSKASDNSLPRRAATLVDSASPTGPRKQASLADTPLSPDQPRLAQTHASESNGEHNRAPQSAGLSKTRGQTLVEDGDNSRPRMESATSPRPKLAVQTGQKVLAATSPRPQSAQSHNGSNSRPIATASSLESYTTTAPLRPQQIALPTNNDQERVKPSVSSNVYKTMSKIMIKVGSADRLDRQPKPSSGSNMQLHGVYTRKSQALTQQKMKRMPSSDRDIKLDIEIANDSDFEYYSYDDEAEKDTLIDIWSILDYQYYSSDEEDFDDDAEEKVETAKTQTAAQKKKLTAKNLQSVDEDGSNGSTPDLSVSKPNALRKKKQVTAEAVEKDSDSEEDTPASKQKKLRKKKPETIITVDSKSGSSVNRIQQDNAPEAVTSTGVLNTLMAEFNQEDHSQDTQPIDMKVLNEIDGMFGDPSVKEQKSSAGDEDAVFGTQPRKARNAAFQIAGELNKRSTTSPEAHDMPSPSLPRSNTDADSDVVIVTNARSNRRPSDIPVSKGPSANTSAVVAPISVDDIMSDFANIISNVDKTLPPTPVSPSIPRSQIPKSVGKKEVNFIIKSRRIRQAPEATSSEQLDEMSNPFFLASIGQTKLELAAASLCIDADFSDIPEAPAPLLAYRFTDIPVHKRRGRKGLHVIPGKRVTRIKQVKPPPTTMQKAMTQVTRRTNAPEKRSKTARAKKYETGKSEKTQNDSSDDDSEEEGEIDLMDGMRRRDKNIPKALFDPRIRKQVMAMQTHQPRFSKFIMAVNVLVMLYEFIVGYIDYGEIISMSPAFNPMIGPRSDLLVRVGARFVPCMRPTIYANASFTFPCPDNYTPSTKVSKTGSMTAAMTGSTLMSSQSDWSIKPVNRNSSQFAFKSSAYTSSNNSLARYTVMSAQNSTIPECQLSDYCGMGGFSSPYVPDQWWRFITPIFLHGGLVHLIANSWFWYQTGFPMEEAYGAWRVAVIYFISGVGGFMFSANLAVRTPSIGASGAIYGVLAVVLLDLVMNFKIIPNRWAELGKLMLTIVISLAVGLLPYIDNFAHVGGFIIGTLLGLVIMPSINFGKWDARWKMIIRAIAAPSLCAFFVWLVTSFYTGGASTCTWCKYVDCLPVMGWCDGYD